jgi:hypothetical protein
VNTNENHMRYHLTSVRIATVKNGYGEKDILAHWEYKLVQPLWKTVWRFLKQPKIQLLYDPEISLLDICRKVLKSVCGRDICSPRFTIALLIMAKIKHQNTHQSINRKRKCGIYIK